MTTTYTVNVYGKCDSVKKTVTVVVIPLPKPVITGKTFVCSGVKDTLHVSGGSTYKWSNGSTSTSYITGVINADSVVKVVAYNSLGCLDSTRFVIDVITQTVTVAGASICSGDCVTLKAISTGNGITYNWSNGATTDTTTVCDTANTTYSVTVNNGCIYKRAATVTVYAPSLNACCDTTILSGESTTLIAQGSNFTWTPKSTLNCDTCSTVIATPTVTTTYTVTGLDSHGCPDSRILTVIVNEACFDFKVPNVFSPNGDGIDETFEIDVKNIDSWLITIYDRWGKEMFKTTNPNVYWNGSTESGAKAPTGVYYYILSGTCKNATYKKDGFLQLIR